MTLITGSTACCCGVIEGAGVANLKGSFKLRSFRGRSRLVSKSFIEKKELVDEADGEDECKMLRNAGAAGGPVSLQTVRNGTTGC